MNKNSRTIGEQLSDFDEMMSRNADKIKNSINVSIPAIVISFDPIAQTISAQPTIKAKIRQPDDSIIDVALPVVQDVPISLPRAGGFAVTLPIQEGDECLLIASDNIFNAWHNYGGIQNQEYLLKHTYSSCIALVGISSIPNVLPNYSTDSLQLRTFDGFTYAEVKEGVINVNAAIVNIDSEASVNINSPITDINSAEINLGVGGNNIARKGDAVEVTVPGHGVCSGTITSGGENTSI